MYSLTTLNDCHNTYEYLGGTNRVFDFLQRYGTRYEVAKTELPTEDYHDGSLLTHCIQVAGSIAEQYGYQFFTGLISLNGWGLASHSWNMREDGILFDATYQYREYLTVDRVYYGVPSKTFCDIFTLAYNSHNVGNIYYHQYLYLWRKMNANDGRIYRDWWNDYEVEILGVTTEQMIESEFSKQQYYLCEGH